MKTRWTCENGIFEIIAEDGCCVDLTQPGLMSRHQLISILRKRGLNSLLEKVHSTSDIVSAYFKYILPLPSRECEIKLRFQAAQTRQPIPPKHRPALSKRPQSTSLENLVIVSNPKWTTSGQQTAAVETGGHASPVKPLAAAETPDLGPRSNDQVDSTDLVSLIIVNKSDWAVGEKQPITIPMNKSPSSVKQSPHPVPLKRRKLNRTFANYLSKK